LVSMMELFDIFKALGDKTRMRIMSLLSKQELCVCQISEVLKMSQPNASKHLHRLRYSGLIVCRKLSQWCFYSINEDFIFNNTVLFQYLMGEWSKHKFFTDDTKKLNNILLDFKCCKVCMQKSKDTL